MSYIADRLKEASTWKSIIVGALTVISVVQPQYAIPAQALIGVILGHTIVTPDPKK